MSAEMREPIESGANLPEGLIGVDELHHDYSAHVAYSSNPSPTRSAEEHPIKSLEASMFSRPDVVEALEAVHLATTPSAETQFDDSIIAPFEPKLAISGLAWLRNNLGLDGKRLRQTVVDTKSSLLANQHREAEIQQARLNLSQQEVAEEEAQRLAAVAREARRAEQEAKQAGYRGELEACIELIEKTNPDTDAQSFLGVGLSLVIYELADGKPAAREEKVDFQDSVNQRVREYLEGPSQLFNDYKLGGIIDSLDLPAKQIEIVEAYRMAISTAILARLDITSYSMKDFVPETIAKWIRLEDNLPAEISEEEFKRRWDDEDPDVHAYNGAARLVGRVLSNSLQAIAKGAPAEFVDRLYMLAELGLDPKRPARNNQTVSCIVDCLRNEPQAGYILNLSWGTEPVEARRKAIDLDLTLNNFKVPDRIIGYTAKLRHNVLSLSKRRALSKEIQPSFIPPIGSSPALKTKVRSKLQAEFLCYVDSPEGGLNTIFGRFEQHAKEVYRANESPDVGEST